MNKFLNKYWWKHNLYVSAIKMLPLSEKQLFFRLDALNLFFILSTGRTGTVWMSEVLSLVDGAHIEHEPIPVEVYAHMDAVYSEIKAENYIKILKRKDIFIRMIRQECEIYGEVNGNLRRHSPFLKKYFPKAKLLHLVRDGRKVIRSVLARNTFKGDHPVFGTECPLPSKELNRKWSTMDEFEKACWVWREENAYIRQHVPCLARLEDITTSYEAFQTQVLTPLGLSLSESVWVMHADVKVNESRMNRVRLDEDWSEEQIKMFDFICGDEMKALGYR